MASSGGNDNAMAKSLIITREGPALIWYTRLPSLSIDSWVALREKFLLNFQGYRPQTDALAELSLCRQLERESLHDYYSKFLSLKSQLPSVEDGIAIHYAISGLRAGQLYSHCTRDPQPPCKSYISCLRNMHDPKTSITARLRHSKSRGNHRNKETLKPGQEGSSPRHPTK